MLEMGTIRRDWNFKGDRRAHEDAIRLGDLGRVNDRPSHDEQAEALAAHEAAAVARRFACEATAHTLAMLAVEGNPGVSEEDGQ